MYTKNSSLSRLTQRIIHTTIFVLCLFMFIPAGVQAAPSRVVVPPTYDYTPAQVIKLTNNARVEANLSKLKSDKKLSYIAQTKAKKMAETGQFAHVLKDGQTLHDLLVQNQYVYQYAGENLAVHFFDKRELVDAWLASPTHRANILNGNFTRIGIGIAYGSYQDYDGWFVVQLFATPMPR